MKSCVGGLDILRLTKVALGFGIAAAFMGLTTTPQSFARGFVAESSSPQQRERAAFLRRRHVQAHYAPAAGDPPFAAIVVDANSGRELYGVNENALRHPASITKVMTLYLLFEQIDKGAMTLQTPIPISEHAAAQEPSKLGIAAGDSLPAEDAIKAVVTRSANDVAVAIAEAIGHDESTFAQMMTRKAHALGMSRTLYRNASGLPNDEQWTTAHDLTILARSLEERYPKYFRYFSTHEFDYDGEVIGNHNHLLGRIDGVDGIKTGYTRASGFNLLTSVHRDGRSLLAVVLGGRSAGVRDRIMENLIEEHIAEASDRGHTAPLIADNESPVATPPARPAPAPVVAAAIPVAKAAPKIAPQPPHDGADAEGDDSDDDAPPVVKAFANSETAKTEAIAKADTAAKLAAAAKLEAPHGALTRPVAIVAQLDPPARPADPAALGWVKGPDGVAAKSDAASPEAAKTRDGAQVVSQEDTSNAGHLGWIIQIGASDDAGKVSDLLSRARAQEKSALASAKPFTEKFVKDGDTFYRARFAGLDETSAAEACKTLRHNGFPCFATHQEQ